MAKSFLCVFMDRDEVEDHKHAITERGQYPEMRVSQGGSSFPCSLSKLPYVPMFPHIFVMFSECFRTVIFRILFPCSQKLANVPLFPSVFCQCSLVPKNPWESLRNLDRTSLVSKLFYDNNGGNNNNEFVGKSRAIPSCPLGQPITTQGLSHLARSRGQPYNNIQRGQLLQGRQ